MNNNDVDESFNYTINLKKINAKYIKFYIDDVITIKKLSSNPKDETYILYFKRNYYTETYMELRHYEFRQAIDILIKFANRGKIEPHSDFNQELNDILTKEPYSMNIITLIVKYLNHYQRFKKHWQTLYKYLTNIKTHYLSKLWPMESVNKMMISSKFFQYYNDYYHENRYLNRYMHSSSMFRMIFLQNKFPPLMFHLIQKIISYFNDIPYYTADEKDEEVILYRGVYDKLAKYYMNLNIGDILHIKSFQSQTYNYSVAKKYSQDGNLDSNGLVLNFKYPKTFKYLCFDRDLNEVFTYPNCRYRIDKIYFNNFIVNCDLVYLDNSMDDIKINLPDFDRKFITVLEYFNYYPFNIDWFYFYLYFIENIEILDQIIIEHKLKLVDVNFFEENYLIEFEEYMSNFMNISIESDIAFEEPFDDNMTKQYNEDISSDILKDKMSDELKNEIIDYINDNYTHYIKTYKINEKKFKRKK